MATSMSLDEVAEFLEEAVSDEYPGDLVCETDPADSEQTQHAEDIYFLVDNTRVVFLSANDIKRSNRRS